MKSLSILITCVFWTLHLIGWLSLFLLILLLEFWSVLHISLSLEFCSLPVFLSVYWVELLWLHLLCQYNLLWCKRRSLKYSAGCDNLLCSTVCDAGVREGTLPFAGVLAYFQALPPIPVCCWHPSSCFSGAESQSRWVCVHSRAMWVLWTVSWETGSFFHHAILHWFLQPEVMRFYIPSTGTWAAWTSLELEGLAPQVSSQFPSATGECGTACSASCCYHYHTVSSSPNLPVSIRMNIAS